MNISQVLTVSRPRFWLYEGATFALIGAIAGSLAMGGSIAFLGAWQFWAFVCYFLIPANILIYGINDIFDYDTDKVNPKKGTYEALVTPEKQKSLWYWIICTNLPFLFIVPHTLPVILSFSVFLGCAIFYSALPIRAKARPVIDSLFSAGHYTATGVMGYYMVGALSGNTSLAFPLWGSVAAILWCVAMHAFSAIPDIEADTTAGLMTIAMLIGKKSTIILCAVLYTVAACIALRFVPIAAIVGGALLLHVMIQSYHTTSDEALFALYKRFPIVNAVIGMLVSLELLFQLLQPF